MKRAIIAPTALPVSAIAELKQWLGLNSSREDPTLAALLLSSIDMCEAFTGSLPIEALCEEIWIPTRHWQTLSSRPVQAIVGIEALAADGTRTPLACEDYAIDLDADGAGRFRIAAPVSGRVAVRFTAGIAPDWESLPDALRHGVIRLAAHQFRSREDDNSKAAAPPIAVAALWRPWRRVRLT